MVAYGAGCKTSQWMDGYDNPKSHTHTQARARTQTMRLRFPHLDSFKSHVPDLELVSFVPVRDFPRPTQLTVSSPCYPSTMHTIHTCPLYWPRGVFF